MQSQARVLVPLHIEGPPPPLGQPLYALQGETMGTSWSLRFHAPAGLQLNAIERAVQVVLEEVIGEMSQWESDSLLCLFNRMPAGGSAALPRGFARVVDAALQIARASEGAFDPTALELVRSWGFGPPGAAVASRCDWRRLEWDGSKLTQPGDARLDLSAIAKGHAVDRVSETLAGIGITHHLVEIGGELRGAGLKPQGQPWWVDLEPPSADCGLMPLRIALHGLSIATSGDYRRFRLDNDGRRRSHTVDPRSGVPIAHGLASVSVVHESAMWADGWSTALMVMGLADGLAFAKARGLAARFVQRENEGGGDGEDFSEQLSPALTELLT